MSRFFVTGSTQGIGLETVETLRRLGHDVVAHARNAERATAAKAVLDDKVTVLTGDLSSLAETRQLARAAEEAGPYEAVIHNAGVGGGQRRRTVTVDGLELIFQVNVVAPYVLTALMTRPPRLVYLTSGLEANGELVLDDLQRERRAWDGMAAYSDSKLCDVMLAFAVARRFPAVVANAVDPGWIKTRVGGPGAPDPLELGAETQVWLATSDDPAALVSGRYLYRGTERRANPVAYDTLRQDELMRRCEALTGVALG